MIVPLSGAARRLSDILKRLGAGKKLSAADQSFCQRVIEANQPGRPRDSVQLKLPIYSSLGEASGATGIPLPLLKQAKKAGCAAFKWNRVDLAEFLKWAFAQEHHGDDGIDWSNELRKWMAKRQKIHHDRDARLVVGLDRASEEIHSGMALLFTELDRVFGNELPPIVKGLGEQEIRDRNLAEIERLKETLRSKLLALIKPAVDAHGQK